MFRVMYRWEVSPQNFAKFQDAWRATTNHIHETVPGAKGSFMLRSIDNENEVITIAKWDCQASWQSFWGHADPNQMHEMRSLGHRISVETFDEIDDQSKK